MRFVRLSLEKYGRFDGCELQFPARSPDLHVIKGGNEAGKSTSRSAVADLLFGFPARSPYNFRFDYRLLRIGAVVEADGTKFEFRRRKTNSNSLIDANENPISESLLLAMLKGQTRDTFQLSFSLDQDALRKGGAAMVAAKDDVGQALFAAGSGLVGISDRLKALEAEADEIWGPRARASRAYTQASRALEAAQQAVKEASLKPKEWKDARDAQEEAWKRLKDLERERDKLLAESQKIGRIRRVAGDVRIRQALLLEIQNAGDFVELTPATEAAATAAIEEADKATRNRQIAERLLNEIEEKVRAQQPDPAVLDEAQAIEDLVNVSGAVTKALHDLVGLRAQRQVDRRTLEGLRAKAGAEAGIILSAETVESLRKLAAEHAQDAAALQAFTSQQDQLETRRNALEARLAEEQQDEDPRSLADAVDAARRLGADVDDRCDAARRAATRAAADLQKALAKLKPWLGGIEDLACLAVPSAEEIERAKRAWDREKEMVSREEENVRRLEGEVKRLTLEIGAVGRGVAISPQELTASREARAAHWAPIRAHLLGQRVLADGAGQAEAYEAAVKDADEVADRRFTFAEGSARLVSLEADRARLEEEIEQARRNGKAAADRLTAEQETWRPRLQSLGLPDLDPVQITGWLALRDAAISAQDALDRAEEEASHLEERRATAAAALRHAIGETAGEGEAEVAGVLRRAQRSLAEVTERRERQSRDRRSLIEVREELVSLSRHKTSITAKLEPRMKAWNALLAGTGMALDIDAANARLSALDAVRQAEQAIAGLDERIRGITEEADRFNRAVQEVGKRLGDDVNVPDAEVVKRLRERLARARATAEVVAAHHQDRSKRQKEIDESRAAYEVAMDRLAPVLEQTGCRDPSELSVAIERSRQLREKRDDLARAEDAIIRNGDGKALDELVELVMQADPDALTAQAEMIGRQVTDLNARVTEAAEAYATAKRTFEELEKGSTRAPDAAFDAEQARAEMATLAEAYVLKRTQALVLRWAIERYRERHQNPLVARASKIFSTLTLGRYGGLDVELDGSSPRLLGLTQDGTGAVEVDAMSEGTTDQLFLALRLASIEQTIDAGIRLPFIADDLFVNFDDDRARAGFQVLADLARKTQVLFFTHHAHLADIVKSVIGEEAYSECMLV
ncbi:ATP-binding protein [Roseomonas rosulenta]|uniref:ATP-binding protein n=1 Tax=Roseomonas rosulenta TaxID=2748667 RepID=UPI0018DFA181|nr:YhaN family protein [Roseomonas rosulenta]